MKKLFIFFLVVFLLVVGKTAWAIPSMGVAPAAGTGGAYNFPNSADPDYDEPYIQYFVGSNYVINPGGNNGFVVPDSGGSLTVWFGRESGLRSGDFLDNIWLATDSQYARDGGFSFGGQTFEQIYRTTPSGVVQYGDQADGYKPLPYWGVSLGTLTSSGWTQAPAGSPFNDNAGEEYYFFTANIVYDGFALNQEDWFFAFLDANGNGVFDTGEAFSPKTTSSSTAPVPEPATMILLGTGLVGFACFGRKKFLKR